MTVLSGYKFLIATTSIINGSKLVSSVSWHQVSSCPWLLTAGMTSDSSPWRHLKLTSCHTCAWACHMLTQELNHLVIVNWNTTDWNFGISLCFWRDICV